jgi:hypothetical protein
MTVPHRPYIQYVNQSAEFMPRMGFELRSSELGERCSDQIAS